MKKCPFCAEQIQDAAIKCRFCGSDLVSSSKRSCPFCSSQIPATATICPSCGDDVTYGSKSESTREEVTATLHQRQKASPNGLVIAIVLVCAIVLIGSILSAINDRSSTSSNAISPNASSPEISAPPSATARPVLELNKWNWHQEYGHVQVDGQVKNISVTSLKNVSVVVSFYDKDGNFITTESALIDYNPILSGQLSPFKVLGTWNPAMKRADIQFKELTGGKLEHISVSK